MNNLTTLHFPNASNPLASTQLADKSNFSSFLAFSLPLLPCCQTSKDHSSRGRPTRKTRACAISFLQVGFADLLLFILFCNFVFVIFLYLCIWNFCTFVLLYFAGLCNLIFASSRVQGPAILCFPVCPGRAGGRTPAGRAMEKNLHEKATTTAG